MRTLSDLVTELVRAANNAEKLPEEAKLRLLGRAYVTILEAREDLETSSAEAYRQAGVDLISATGHVRTLSCDDVKTLLLDAAEMIRQIKMVIDSKAERTGD